MISREVVAYILHIGGQWDCIIAVVMFFRVHTEDTKKVFQPADIQPKLETVPEESDGIFFLPLDAIGCCFRFLLHHPASASNTQLNSNKQTMLCHCNLCSYSLNLFTGTSDEEGKTSVTLHDGLDLHYL